MGSEVLSDTLTYINLTLRKVVVKGVYYETTKRELYTRQIYECDHLIILIDKVRTKEKTYVSVSV